MQSVAWNLNRGDDLNDITLLCQWLQWNTLANPCTRSVEVYMKILTRFWVWSLCHTHATTNCHPSSPCLKCLQHYRWVKPVFTWHCHHNNYAHSKFDKVPEMLWPVNMEGSKSSKLNRFKFKQLRYTWRVSFNKKIDWTLDLKQIHN